MTLRIIVKTDSANMAANIGGGIQTISRTFEVEVPEVEKYLRHRESEYEFRQVIGVEVVN